LPAAGSRRANARSPSAGKCAAVCKFQIGDTFRTGGNALTVVGEFDGGNTAFDSEVWMDADEARSLFDRESYSSLLVRAASRRRQGIISRIEATSVCRCWLNPK